MNSGYFLYCSPNFSLYIEQYAFLLLSWKIAEVLVAYLLKDLKMDKKEGTINLWGIFISFSWQNF